MKTQRLTTAQALVSYLCAQSVEIEDFADAVRGHGKPQRNAEEAYHNACAIDALLRSARQHGAPQTVAP